MISRTSRSGPNDNKRATVFFSALDHVQTAVWAVNKSTARYEQPSSQMLGMPTHALRAGLSDGQVLEAAAETAFESSFRRMQRF